MENRKAFTLIELLVVIAVISIIAAILFPVFARVREKARQTACLNNMKQLGMAFQQYTEDYDEMLPSATDGGNGGAGVTGGWLYTRQFPPASAGDLDPVKGSIYPYVKSKAVYVCPDDSTGQRYGDSYAVNSCTLRVDSAHTQQPWPGKSLAAIESPSEFMQLGEEGLTADDSSSTDDADLWFGTNTLTSRHSGGSNVTFVDGHVKWYHTSDATTAKLQIGNASSGACY